MNYTAAFLLTITLVTYILKIPHRITGQPSLVNEYYITGFPKNVLIDWVLVWIYLWIAERMVSMIDCPPLLTISITTFAISYLWMIYFQTKGDPTNFFTRWFKTVGISGVLYDVILITVVYIFQHHTN